LLYRLGYFDDDDNYIPKPHVIRRKAARQPAQPALGTGIIRIAQQPADVDLYEYDCRECRLLLRECDTIDYTGGVRP
jgi:hypothetical protein